MLNKQEQEIGDNSIANQAGNDIIINQNFGLQFSEVKEIFHFLFSENFPKFKEIAESIAKQNVERILTILEEKLFENKNSIDFGRLKDPDIQFSLNEVVDASARKGENIDLGILADLIISRLDKNESELVSLVATEAIKIVPKLSKAHISFLTLNYLIFNNDLKNLAAIEDLEKMGQGFYKLTSSCFSLSDQNILFIQYAGLISRMDLMGSIINWNLKTCPILSGMTQEQFLSELTLKAPTYKIVLDAYLSLRMDRISLTSVGELIALTNFTRIADYRIIYSDHIK